jgi:hypothetical protein
MSTCFVSKRVWDDQLGPSDLARADYKTGQILALAAFRGARLALGRAQRVEEDQEAATLACGAGAPTGRNCSHFFRPSAHPRIPILF